jgi:hypothetical protein
MKEHKIICPYSVHSLSLHQGLEEKVQEIGKSNPNFLATIKREGFNLKNLFPNHVNDGQVRQVAPWCQVNFEII